MILLLCRFQNHASHRGWGAYFQKIRKYFVKKVLEAWKAQSKQQIVYEIDKFVASMHTLIFAGWALGAKNARDCSQKQYFEEGTERKNGDRNGEKSEKSKLNDNENSY